MKFEFDRLPEYTDEALIAELQRVSASVPGKYLSLREFERRSKVSASTLRRRFGGWEEALNVAGLRVRYDPSTLTIKMKEQRGKGLTEIEILEELRRIAKLLGRSTLTTDEFNCHSQFEEGVVRRRFGTWKTALLKAGLAAVPLGQRYSDDECFENLLNVWTNYGRPPKHREMNLAPSRVGPKAYIKRWGTWNKTLHAFVERANRDAPESDSVAAAPAVLAAELSRPARTEAEQREIRLGLRYAVLRRDHFRCVLCGASPAITPGCILHIDHIIPFAKGGKTVIENLRTACDRCNVGKGTKLDNDA